MSVRALDDELARVAALGDAVDFLEEAVGQYEIYRLLLAATDPERALYMAVSGGTYRGVLADQFGQFVVSGLNLHLVVFDEQQERIVQWIG